MIDITHKTHTLRSATAQAIVLVSKPETILAIERGMVPKGDVFSMSKAAGLLGVKRLQNCSRIVTHFRLSTLGLILKSTDWKSPCGAPSKQSIKQG